jgi:lysophospholipase L1-like esterase
MGAPAIRSPPSRSDARCRQFDADCSCEHGEIVRSSSARSGIGGAVLVLALAPETGCGLPAEVSAQPLSGSATRTVVAVMETGDDGRGPPLGTDPPGLAGAFSDSDAATADEEPVLGVEQPVLGVEVSVYDPSGTALRAFHEALRRAALGEGQARVVVYGASHVAGDLAIGTLRRALQAEFGDAGHGFVLPVHPWPTYRHSDVVIESNHRRWRVHRVHAGSDEVGRYGLAGVALTTSSARAYGRVHTGEHTASRFELFYWREPGGGTIEVRIDGRLARRIPTRSVESGPAYALFTVPDAPHAFEIRARGDGPVTIFGVAIEREVPGVVVDTLGINGARAANQLLWEETLWREHIRRRAPDLVVLAYGTNESGDDDQPIEMYEAGLRQVLARFRHAVPQASCLLIGPSDRPLANGDGTYSERPRTSMIIDVQRRVAVEYNCAFFDLVAFGGGPLHMLQWAALDPPWAQRDLVHFTARGYRRLGEVLHKAILEGYTGPMAPLSTPTVPIASR